MMTNPLETYIKSHYGYGNPRADFWLIGMEEGGGGSREEILRRVEIWHELGANEVTNLVEFHNRLGYPEFFQDPVKHQTTWAQLIRIVLAADGLPTHLASVKAYQRDRLGRPDGDTCLLELLPLPSPGTKMWNYGEWTGLPYLKDRDTYALDCIPWRTEHLREMVARYEPKVVVFYGLFYRPHYARIAGEPFTKDTTGLEWSMHAGTLFVLAKHPAARGKSVGPAYFEGIGHAIRAKLAESQEPHAEPAREELATLQPYGLYRCKKCGKLSMGYDFQAHLDTAHKGRYHGCEKIR